MAVEEGRIRGDVNKFFGVKIQVEVNSWKGGSDSFNWLKKIAKNCSASSS